MQGKIQILLILIFGFLHPGESYAQWEAVPGYGQGNLTQLETAGPGQLFALFQGGGLFRSDNYGLSWSRLQLPNSATLTVESFALTPTYTLFVVANAGIWRSDNGGNSWDPVVPGFSGDGTERTIAVAGDSLFVARYGKLYRADLNSGQLNEVYSIEPDYKMRLFSDDSELWIAPLQGNIRMTADQGETWINYPPDFYGNDICFKGDTVWSVPNTVPNQIVHFIVKGNLSNVYSRTLPVANSTPTITSTSTDLFLVYPDFIYRYLSSTASWETSGQTPNGQALGMKFLDGFQYLNTGAGLMRKAPGSDWNLCNTGIPSGNPIGFQHFENHLFAYGTYANGILPTTTPYWVTPHQLPAALIGKGPGGFYACHNTGRLWFTPNNLQEWTDIGPAPTEIAYRTFAVHDTLFAISGDRKIFRSPAPGQDWQLTGVVPVEQSGFYKKLLILDSMLYAYDTNMKFFRLNSKIGQMLQTGTVPGSFNQDFPAFDALPPAIFLRSNNLYYSPNEGQTWTLWPETDIAGQSLLFKDFVASEAGFYGLNQFPAQIYFAEEPGDPFVRLAFPPMDTLSQPNLNAVVAIEYVNGYLYAVQSSGAIFRRKVDKQALHAYSGHIWRDNNSNGLMDSSDGPVKGLTVQRGGFRFAITDDSGKFTLYDDLDVDTLKTRSPWPGWTVHPSYRIDTLPSDTLDFRLTPPFFRNYCIDMGLFNLLRPGFPTKLYLNWQNLGAADNATIRFVYPGNDVELLSVSPAPDMMVNDTLVWELANILPAQEGSIIIQLKTNTSTPIGTPIAFLAEVLPVIGDEKPANNRSLLSTAVVGSFDPNDKQVEPANYTITDLHAATPLEYTIRFQNTGNYPASFVVIRDTIAENLDLASLQIMAASHPYRLSLLNDRILEFTFDPIILPDSISNEPASHGFIKYSIVPNAAIPIGARAYNTAYIYFDFNTPVQTNTVETTISTASNVNTPGIFRSLIISPNPASAMVRVELPENMPQEQSALSILDISGRLVHSLPVHSNSIWLSLEGIPKGTYIIQWKTRNHLYTGKLLLQ
ncbi:MAG: T9SS type A sorting domain-containing protein [Saprospiraceae bacterium]|nr:T9SS type A sorting domain-containing protein [Saprospiraceae bacterium]